MTAAADQLKAFVSDARHKARGTTDEDARRLAAGSSGGLTTASFNYALGVRDGAVQALEQVLEQMERLGAVTPPLCQRCRMESAIPGRDLGPACEREVAKALTRRRPSRLEGSDLPPAVRAAASILSRAVAQHMPEAKGFQLTVEDVRDRDTLTMDVKP